MTNGSDIIELSPITPAESLFEASEAFIRNLQAALNDLGFPILVDGLWGPETDETLGAWAAAEGALHEDERAQAVAAIAASIAPSNPNAPRPFLGTPFAALPIGAHAFPRWPIPHKGPGRPTVCYRGLERSVETSRLRHFGAPRSSKRELGNGTVVTLRRWHCGVDLFCDEGDPVKAMEGGVVVNSYPFVAGKRADGSRFKVSCLLVKSDSNGQVINYAEVDHDSMAAKVGDRVEVGQQLATVGKMRRSSMLHVEIYAAGETRNRRWKQSARRPKTLLDPTAYLLAVRDHYFPG